MPHAVPRTRLRRPIRARGLVRIGVLLWLPIAAVAPAQAAAPRDERERDETERWVPSFALFFDMLGQKGAGSVTSGPVLGPPLDPFDAEQDAVVPGNGCVFSNRPPFGPPVVLRTNSLCPSFRANLDRVMGDSSSSDTSIAPLVGASLELMTPSPLDSFLRPRLFVRGDFAAAFAFERNLAGQESPGEFAFPDGLVFDPDRNAQDLEEIAIKGQGSRARMQVRRFVYGAGGGIAFSFDLFKRRVRIKPSLEYLHYELDISGVVHRALKLREPSGTADLSGFRQISLSHEEQQVLDGIGPGLELEIDTARLGPFVTSVYIMGRGYHLFGDLETSFTVTNEFGETASFTIEPDNWVWRSGVGFRFRWLPE